jgi:ABC-type transporter Mla subunit MlaD
MSTPLRVVPQTAGLPAGLSEQIRQLQAEANRLAHEHIAALGASLVHAQQIADDIAHGGEAYPAGIRDIARRLSEECAARAQAIEAIAARR